MPRPRAELDDETVAQRVAGALLHGVVGGIDQATRSAAQIVPRCTHISRRGDVAQVHDHEPTGLAIPAPADEVLEAIVALPPPSLTESPAAVAERGIGDSGRERPMERGEIVVRRLGWVAAEEHR